MLVVEILCKALFRKLSLMKKGLKIAGVVFLAFVLLVGTYVAYVYISYYRIEDRQIL